MSKHHSTIYVSRMHLLLTLCFLLVPFAALLLFAGITKISANELFFDLLSSIVRLAIAYGIAVVLAWTLALSFSTGKRSQFALPIFDVMQSFPTFALVPLAMLTFGASSITVIFFLVIAIIWPVLFSIVNTLKLIKAEYWEVADMYQIHGWHRLRYLLLPASIPGVVTGSIIGLGNGWEALVATEIIMETPIGLGSFFQEYSTDALITSLGILLLMIVIFSINRLVWTPVLAKVYHRMQE